MVIMSHSGMADSHMEDNNKIMLHMEDEENN